VTLHVGLGTFKPVDTSDIRDYVIHEEMILIAPELFTKIATYKRAEKNIIAV
jgi:S-adenosylmethionine:tRNA ribosyltransferase-isomerase